MRVPVPTCRDLLVSIGAAAATLLVADALDSQDPVMRSSVFDWEAIAPEPTPNGARRGFFRSRTATLNQLSIHASTVQPGTASHAPHRHSDEELIMVKEGTVEQVLNGARYRLGPGSVTFVAPDDEHGIRNAGDTPATYYIIRWSSDRTAPRGEAP